MSDETVGYGRPPKQFQFKAGTSGNPRGRPKRTPSAAADIIQNVANAPITYRERNRNKTATRTELGLKVLVEKAVKGDVSAANLILKYRLDASRVSRASNEIIEVIGGLPADDS